MENNRQNQRVKGTRNEELWLRKIENLTPKQAKALREIRKKYCQYKTKGKIPLKKMYKSHFC